jgi:signal transduction histidine kinase/HAMP domain-containing protein
MRKKLIYSLFVLFALFSLGTGITMLYIYRTTSDLQSVINLHRVEIIRQHLVINAQTVQSHLYTIGTVFGKELDIIVENVIDLDKSVHGCLGCHHTEEMTQRLNELNGMLDQYKDALSYLITTSAGKERVERLRIVAISIGNNLLSKTQEMSVLADQRLNSKTVKALNDINNSRAILIITILISFFIALAIAITMTRQITEPINELVNATRKIKMGALGYTTSYKGKGEFGELMDSFNDMSTSLKESNQKIMHHLHSLSNLYNITLTFHAITNKADIYKELSHGVSELIGAEQCGVMILEDGNFVHMLPAVGLSRESAESLRFSKDAIIPLYHSTKRKAFILNENIDPSPTAEADRRLNVRNLMLVWVRHKGELVGALRVANKKEGDFTEEDSRLLAILASNFSVALENADLYDDLRRQMHELRDAQEQLIQAAKLVAIGELASNVAHEINNPLTSILGYAELIKEEKEMDNIMRDLDIIEKESLRARDIVQQLLEFSRKRPLEIKTININEILEEAIGLTSFQIKDKQIRISKSLGEIPPIDGDSNQLKQVFLNIINNAVFAMQRSGVLGITTYAQAEELYVVISDTGYGIPKEVLPKIFDPFFTTKKEKGTGLGLSISFKIIQSHNGNIIVESEEGKGTRFTITLPTGSGGFRKALKMAAQET